MRWTCRSAAGRDATARPRTSSPTSPSYDAELERALALIGEQHQSLKVLVYGHSAGGLIVSLWLDRLRRRGADGARAASAAWCSTARSWICTARRCCGLPVTSAMIAGAVAAAHQGGGPRQPARAATAPRLHRDYDGEFDYNLQWKPLGGFPITLGWLHAVRRGQARLHRGLDVGVPNLILRSDHSVRETADPAAMQCGDAVLDVTQIARWAGCIGNRSTIVPVADAKHDVFLSLPQPRQVAYRQLDLWLDGYLDAPIDTDASASSGKG